MATAKISLRTVNELSQAGFLWDDDLKGFGVRVSSAGVRSYIFQYRLGGREAAKKRYTIGRHGSPWTPKTARDEAERLALLVGQGIDPVDADKERRRQAVDLAFSSYIDTFATGYLKLRWKRWEASKRLLERDAAPILKAKPLPKIKLADLSELWDSLADRPATAKLMHATLRKLFRWAVERGDIERSPLEGVGAPAKVASRDRVLSDDELKSVWLASELVGDPFASCLKLLALTGARRQEVASLHWSELDRSTAIWTLPVARSKNSVAHVVPLTADAIALLDGLAGGKSWPTTGFVLTTTAGRKPIDGFSKWKAKLDLEVAHLRAAASQEPLPPWRIHDLRRTVATGLQRLSVRLEVTEAILGHVSGSRAGIVGVYQRHDWASEKREALNLWSATVRLIVAPKAKSRGRRSK